MPQAVIACEQLSKSFHDKLLFMNISITFVQGTSYALQGVSGTGKSTFLSLIGSLDTPTSGLVTYNQQPLHLLSEQHLNQLRMNSLGYLFQHSYLIKELSVVENIELPGLVIGLEKKHCRERAHFLLEKIRLTDKKDAYPAQLSGGQLQRVALARAIFNKPTFLIADEPTANLDYKTAVEIVSLLCDMQTDCNMGIIMSTHDRAIAQMMNQHYEFFEQSLIKK